MGPWNYQIFFSIVFVLTREILFSIFLYNYNKALWIGVIIFVHFICSFFRLVIKSYLSTTKGPYR